MEKDLYTLRWELSLNQCRLSDVASQQAELTKQWDELQLVREGIIKQMMARRGEEWTSGIR